MAASGSESAMFRTSFPGQAVAVLLIIENSMDLKPLWHELRDCILPSLFSSIAIENQDAPVSPSLSSTAKSCNSDRMVDTINYTYECLPPQRTVIRSRATGM
jgi:hypothetical protein